MGVPNSINERYGRYPRISLGEGTNSRLCDAEDGGVADPVSYDLRLLAVPAGVEVDVAYQQLIQREETEVSNVDDLVKRTLPVSSRARMQDLADLLRVRWTVFVQFEPKSPLPWIELNDEDLQVQVSVYEDSVSITMPYFRERTSEMMDCIERCIRACQEHCGYTAFDPQLGRAVTADDCDSIAEAYHQMNAALPEIRGGSPARKRWWKFWSR